VAWGAGTIVVARLLRSGDPPDLLAFTAVQHVAGGLVLVAFALPAAGEIDWGSGELWLAGAWVSIGSSAIATVAFFEALRRMTAARASTWQFLVPAVAVLVEALAGTAPGGLVLLGMAVSIAGVCVVSLAERAPVPGPTIA
jgi:drug/metabolite transporter (DMT)-like permease